VSRSRRLVTAAVLGVALTAPPCRAEGWADWWIQLAPVQAVDPAAAVQAGDPEDNPQFEAIRVQYEPRVKVELSLANRVAKWNEQERDAAITAAVKFLRGFAGEMLNKNPNVNQGMMLFIGPPPAGFDDPSVELENKLAAAVEATMPKETREAYREERTKRNDFRVHAAIENIVAQMDEKLDLAPEQRRAIIASLRENWKPEWTPPLQLFVQMSQYTPSVPDEHVMPHLTEEQRVVWQGVQKISARGTDAGLNAVFGGNVMPIDDIDLTRANK
jgi:hypothetical protein